jgi:hypothetical protein
MGHSNELEQYKTRWLFEFCGDPGAAAFALSIVKELSGDDRWLSYDVPTVSLSDTPTLWFNRQKSKRELQKLSGTRPAVVVAIGFLAERYLARNTPVDESIGERDI